MKDKYDDNCPGCRPMIIDAFTGKPMGPETHIMQCANAVWRQTPRAEREAFHRVCCLNSRDPNDVAIMQAITKRIEAALKAN